jgi:hypothetical protein
MKKMMAIFFGTVMGLAISLLGSLAANVQVNKEIVICSICIALAASLVSAQIMEA